MADAVATIEEFLSVARKSGLVDEARLEAACAAWPDRSLPLPDELVQKLVADELLTQWQVDQLRKGKHRGFILGKYKLLSLLGAGGMSSVYLAEHVNLQEKFAIKVLPVKNVDKTSYLARFEREAREACRLVHPNIVRAIDLDTSGAIHYLAMDYVEGIDLHAAVKQEGPLPVHEAADYVRQAALGLQYAHGKGVVHRDIKPANLILDRHGGKPVIKILDFGLALAGKEDDDGSLTQEYGEKVLGTADYLAPEQARDSHLADARSDIYALGCTLYFLLVGKVPFPGGKLADRIRAHQDAKPPNPLDVRPDVPPAIVELYFRMMKKHPEARPQSAQEVADALAPWSSAATAATGAAASPQFRPPPRRTAIQADGTAAPAPAGPAIMAPPGSGTGRRPPGSGVTGFPVGPTPRSRSGVTPGKGAAPAGKPGKAGKAAAQRGTGTAKAAAAGEEPEKPARPRRPWTFAGLPLGFWIVAVVGTVIAITLAVLLLLSRGAEERDSTWDETTVERGPARTTKPAGSRKGKDQDKGKSQNDEADDPAAEESDPAADAGDGTALDLDDLKPPR